ncbi:MAG: hypothetical protein HZA48_12165 [Planctomycetes bacterium]|nr:hypothetical protein [Planctomycetota bacterium]
MHMYFEKTFYLSAFLLLASVQPFYAETPPSVKEPAGYSIKKSDAGLWEISVDIAVQDEADEAFFDQFAKRMENTSKLIWEMTQGQFYIKEIKISDKCSDGRIIIKKGAKDWDILAGPNAMGGTGATCYESNTTNWYVYAAGRPPTIILTHELLHGIFKFKDENSCACIMRGTQIEGREINKICDDTGHKETGKSCWKRLLDRYDGLKYPDPAYKAGSQPPPMNTVKKHNKEFNDKKENILNKKLYLEMAGIQHLDTGDYEKALKSFQEILKLEAGEPAAWYNIACTYALMNRQKEALEAIEKAIKNGFDDIEWLGEDPDFAQLRQTPEFRKLLNRDK